MLVDVDRIPEGTVINGNLDVGSDVVSTLGVFELPQNLTVCGDLIMSSRLSVPELKLRSVNGCSNQ